MAEQEDLFRVIEAVVAERINQAGGYTAKQLCLDVIMIALDRDPEMTFSNGDIRRIAKRLGQPSTSSGTRQSLSEFVNEGKIEFAGRQERMNNVGFKQPVPVYRGVAQADD